MNNSLYSVIKVKILTENISVKIKGDKLSGYKLSTLHSAPRDMQYLVFPRVLQGTDERPVAAHGVTADGDPVRVGGEVSVDQFGELRESERSSRTAIIRQ